jgi:dihydropteroate synthase
VDVGGESTRPGATPVLDDDELTRVVNVVEALAAEGCVSIDTQKESVARACVRAGARIINDVSSTLVEVAGELKVGYVAMHRQGDSTTMQRNPFYGDVVDEVSAFLRDVAERASRAGVTTLWLDPGIGFGKTADHNWALLANLERFVDLAHRYEARVLVGTSRKRFLGDLADPPLEVEERLVGSLASAAWGMLCGADLVRVHDVAATVQLRDVVTRPIDEVGP